MSVPMVYAGQFVEQLILYHLVIAENLIKIYSGKYVGEKFQRRTSYVNIDLFSKT